MVGSAISLGVPKKQDKSSCSHSNRLIMTGTGAQHTDCCHILDSLIHVLSIPSALPHARSLLDTRVEMQWSSIHWSWDVILNDIFLEKPSLPDLFSGSSYCLMPFCFPFNIFLLLKGRGCVSLYHLWKPCAQGLAHCWVPNRCSMKPVVWVENGRNKTGSWERES